MSIPPPTLPSRLTASRTTGTFVTLKDPAAVGLMATAGFQMVVIDREHGVMGPESAATLVTAAKACGVCPIVRIPEPSRSHVQDALESGADGVLAPMVESEEQASMLASWMRYMPRGTRGFHPLTGGSLYGRIPAASLTKTANERVLLAAQIETARGLENCEAIAKVDGVDLLFFGPGDLALSLGVAPRSEAMTAALHRVAKAAQSAGKWFGAFAGGETEAREAFAAGARLVVAAADVAMLAGAARALAESVTRAGSDAR